MIPKSKVSHISFGLLSNDTIKSLSCIELSNSVKTNGTTCQVDTIDDPRFGITNINHLCSTCGNDMNSCNGHPGSLQLVFPVPRGSFLKTPWCVMQRVLNSVCFYCCKRRIPPDEPNQNRRPDKYKDNICRSYDRAKNGDDATFEYGCGKHSPKWVFKKGDVIVAPEWGGDTKGDVCTPHTIYDILSAIDESDYEYLGLSKDSRPEDLMWDILYIPSVVIRPREGKGGDNELTTALKNILKRNSQLKEHIEVEIKNLDNSYIQSVRDYEIDLSTYAHKEVAKTKALELYTSLCMSIACYHDKSNIVQQFNSGSTPKYQSIECRYAGSKENRLRKDMGGKRLDQCARTVAGLTYGGTIDDVGFPIALCKIATFPETVQPYNVSFLTDLVRNGPKYPGANSILLPNGKQINLNYMDRANIVLQYGWVVRRHILDGDPVVVGRFPTLHRHSFLGMYVRPSKDNTVKIHLATTNALNADFDGDELNVHFPQSHETRAEIETLFMVRNRILKEGVPIIKFCMHSLVGLYKMSQREFIPKDMANRLLYISNHTNFCKSDISGKDLFSRTLPSGLFVDLPDLLIEDGVMKHGILNSKTVNGCHGVIHIIVQDFTDRIAADFISNVYMLANEYIRLDGFTVSMSDSFTEQLVYDEQLKLIEDNMGNIDDHMVEEYLDSISSNCGRTVVEHLCKKDNNFKLMVDCGAKGNLKNIEQIMGMLGQQRDDKNGFFTGKTLEERGFVRHSFAHGLNDTEFRIHMSSSNNGLVNTSISTASTGYISRMVINVLKDCIISSDGSIRVNGGQIVEDLYGGDGFSSTRLEYTGDGKYVPIHFSRILSGERKKTYKSDMSPAQVKRWIEKTKATLCNISNQVEGDYNTYVRVDCVPHNRAALDRLSTMFQRTLVRCLSNIGEPVGIIAGQEIGEPATQMSLDTFHKSGQKTTLVSGIPRIEELLYAKVDPKTPSMKVYLKTRTDIEQFGIEICQLLFSEVCSGMMHVDDVEDISDRLSLFKSYKSSDSYSGHMFSWDCSMPYIVARNMERLFPMHDWAYDRGWVLVCVRGVADLYDALQIAESMGNVVVKGVKGVTDFSVHGDHIVTNGSNLRETLSIPDVDDTRTISNNVVEVQRILGIDACREVFKNEFQLVMNVSGTSVMGRHLSIYVNRMTRDGFLRSTKRDKLYSTCTTLRAALYDYPLKALKIAALNGTTDKCDGVTESIFFNNVIPTGTGVVDVVSCDISPDDMVQQLPRRPPKLVYMADTSKYTKFDRSISTIPQNVHNWTDTFTPYIDFDLEL